MKHPWLSREERERVRDQLARRGSLRLASTSKPKPLDAEERARKAAINALADKFGFPHPHRDLDAHPSKEEG